MTTLNEIFYTIYVMKYTNNIQTTRLLCYDLNLSYIYDMRMQIKCHEFLKNLLLQFIQSTHMKKSYNLEICFVKYFSHFYPFCHKQLVTVGN